MSRPCIPKNTADALRQQVYAARNRAEADALETSEPIQARWRRLEANDMEAYADSKLRLEQLARCFRPATAQRIGRI
jgi:hypothetical protein